VRKTQQDAAIQQALDDLAPSSIEFGQNIAGCGGDAGSQPRYRKELGEAYGHILAVAVDDVIRGSTIFPLEPERGPLAAAGGTATLQHQPPREQPLPFMMRVLHGCNRYFKHNGEEPLLDSSSVMNQPRGLDCRPAVSTFAAHTTASRSQSIQQRRKSCLK
jgi:hypothetical protein